MFWKKNEALTDERKRELKERWEKADDGDLVPVVTLTEMLYMKQLERDSKRLPTPEEHNKMHTDIWEMITNKDKATGVGCPECGTELIFVSKENLLSYPPKREAECPKCKYEVLLIG